MATYRIDRLNKEFMRLIAELLGSRIKNADVTQAIITHVEASKDLSVARVYFTLIDDSKKDAVTAALESVKGVIRGELGRQMYIRHVPELRFIYDDSEQKARDMDELIDKVMKEDGVKKR